MTDRNWLLTPTAIAQAKKCIAMVQDEFGIKLKFTQTDFLDRLYGFSQESKSQGLTDSFDQLMNMAGGSIKQALINKHSSGNESFVDALKARMGNSK